MFAHANRASTLIKFGKAKLAKLVFAGGGK